MFLMNYSDKWLKSFISYILSLTMFITGLWVFSSNLSHLLMTLLSLEFIILSIFLMIISMFNFSMIFLSLFFLIFSACEGALGLTVMVNMSRTHGSDFLQMFNML